MRHRSRRCSKTTARSWAIWSDVSATVHSRRTSCRTRLRRSSRDLSRRQPTKRSSRGSIASAAQFPPTVLQDHDSDDASRQQHRVVKPGRNAEEHRVRYNQEHNRERRNPTASVKVVASHWLHRCPGEHVLKTADADLPVVDCMQAGFIEQHHDLARIDVAMAMEMRKQA